MILQSDRDGGLARKLQDKMSEMTWDRHGSLALDNARRNSEFIKKGKSIAALRGAAIGEGDSALIIAAGPSIRRQNTLQTLAEIGFDGAIVATESAMRGCLLNGIVPDLVVTLDPHATRIVRWFGDPNLTQDSLEADDYFRRQEQDDGFANEFAANEQVLSLLNEHGSKIKVALSTSSSAAVVERAIECGMDVYWWNPMLDDPDDPDSVCAVLMAENGLPCINAGGNVGTASWMMAAEVLGKRTVAVTGMDFGYYNDTKYENTQYYNEAVDLVGEENLNSLFVRIDTVHFDTWFYTDPAYLWYQECLLELAAESDVDTINCSRGGILFGPNIKIEPLAEFLTETKQSRSAEKG